MEKPKKIGRSWLDAIGVYRNPRVMAMLVLGFSAGLPLLLVFGTLSAWLREAGVDRGTIGHISWVATLYALKFVWAPLVDRVPVPLLGRLLGQRRGWMLLAQGGVIAGLLLMATNEPGQALGVLVAAALLVAFSSATQDIAIDAWRIESVAVDLQAAMAATYQMGYRIGMIMAGAGALYFAAYLSWSWSYAIMALCMGIGMLAVLLIPEPTHKIDRETWRREARVVRFIENSVQLSARRRAVSAWFIGAIVCPFTEFFARNGRLALLILAFIGVFRLSDITMGVMANPFYIDMGYSKEEIAGVTKVFGLIMTMVGAALGGIIVVRFGIMRMLLAAAIMVAGTNLIFAWLATQTADITLLALVVSADNLSGGFAGSVFIAYLSSLANRAYTATQYALFSSLMLLPAKFLGGFSGDIVDATDYVFFFTYAAMLGLPAILLVLALMYVRLPAAPDPKPTAAG
ncbi:MAG: MFS transporter [Candidatus Thiosymbion ectosymbiont of Robbea hypermnestra]|nr:MFS transporter [Candidatus Thiosymbion ectosymbiont of Robbea hypermnestra]